MKAPRAGRFALTASPATWDASAVLQSALQPVSDSMDSAVLTGAVGNTPPVADDDFYYARPGQTLNVLAPGFLDGDTDADGDAVVATLITDSPDHGTLTAFPDGSFSYTSNAGYVGIDRFDYRISDGFGGFDEGTVTITLVNTNPVADNDDYSARPGQLLSVLAPGFLDGDTDADGDAVVGTLITDSPDHGTLTAFPDGSFSYTSNAGYVGIDRFDYRISDGFGGFDEGTVTINLVNTKPVADDDDYLVHPGVPLTVLAPGFLDGDTDADGDAVVGTLITDSPDHGTLTAFPDGRFTYTPNPGFVGIDRFDYRISDGFGGFDDGTVTLNVSNAPVTEAIRIGDAPVRQSGAGGQWQTAWTDSLVAALQHKADHSIIAAPWSAVALHGAGSSTLSGGDIYRGDLGVSGVSLATSSVVTELDGNEALRFQLARSAVGVRINLERLFTQDDGSVFAESGLIRLLDGLGNVVAESLFRGSSTTGNHLVSLNAPGGFVAIELLAGAYNGASFVYGAYANADGSFGSAPFSNATGQHGSDFMLNWIEFDVPLVGAAAVTAGQDGYFGH